ncbi:MAG: transcription elongation factor GreA [Clostridiales Family XIII bacterium]|jgi:transcription elongation factor GreA|nr:transcription elongation factor GreA [Clostridiales Family XIII bacterium]
MSEEILLTQEGYDAKIAELDELVTTKRSEIAERLKEAISYGDISENSEYDAAKNEQAELEDKIAKIENIIKNAKIIDGKAVKGDRVNLGVKVKVRNSKTKEENVYIIVGSAEADPLEGKLSNESPVGKALLGAKVKEKVAVKVPDGEIKYEILSIGKSK